MGKTLNQLSSTTKKIDGFLGKLLKFSNNIEYSISNLFSKAPHLKNNSKQIIMTLLPFFALGSGFFNLLMVFKPVVAMVKGNFSAFVLLSTLFAFFSAYIFLTCFDELFKKQKIGHDMLFLGVILEFFAFVLDWIGGGFSILILFLFIVIFYLISEVRNSYR